MELVRPMYPLRQRSKSCPGRPWGILPPMQASHDEGSKGAPREGEGRTELEQDEDELGRLLSRTEVELSKPDAVQRREIIAQLKLAAASIKAERAIEAPDDSA